MDEGTVPQLTGPDGELYVTLEHPVYGPVNRKVAEIVLEAFAGPRPTPRHVPVYLNGDKTDSRLANLEWGIGA